MRKSGNYLAACLATALLVTLLAGCASGGSRDGDKTNPGRRAAEINTQLGQGYMSRGQYEIALDKLKKAVREDKTYAPAHTVLAVLYEQLGENELAGQHYELALKADSDSGDVNNNYAAFLCRNGRGKGADKYFQKALEDPFYTTPEVAMANAGSCALERGELDMAEGYLRQSLGYDPEFSDALLAMAGLKFDAGEFLPARGFLQRYESAGPETANSLMMGYRIESQLRNPKDAKGYADRLLDRFPESSQAAEIRKTRRP